MDLEWIPSGPQGLGERFHLGVWAVDTAGFPGDPIYVSDSLYEVSWNYTGQYGRHYVLDTLGLTIPTEVFLGVVMDGSNSDQGMPRAALGLDVHTDALKAFGEAGSWFMSQLPGALALRPFFRGTPDDLSIPEPFRTAGLRVQPQPAGDWAIVHGPGRELEVLNALGATVGSVARPDASQPWNLDLGGLPTGVYLLRSDSGHVTRLIKQ